jgi:Cu2+-exporting ATPase
VFAGQLNLSAPLTVTVRAAGDDTLLAEIVRLMEAAENGQARYRRLADRLIPFYAPVVHGAALATYLSWWLIAGETWQVALLRAVSVLIITCPCALGLAIPAVQVAASGRLFRRGILLKSATALERLAEIDQVVFDKTGTLTRGSPELKDDPYRDEDMLCLAAAMARTSRHPLARALAAARPDAPVLPGVEEVPGRGLQAGRIRLGARGWVGLLDDASIEPELWLSLPGRARLRFAFSETPRLDAAETVAWLRASGYRVSLLSGDRSAAVAAMAGRCGIADWHAGADPLAKVRWVADRKASGRRVLMVGDGLNDAPALAAADVSISPAGAADIAQTAADVVFQGESLSAVREILAVARNARAVIRENLAFAILYNLAAVPLAAIGLATPPVAAALMSSSSLIVVLNALRLTRHSEKKP